MLELLDYLPKYFGSFETFKILITLTTLGKPDETPRGKGECSKGTSGKADNAASVLFNIP